MKKAFLRFKNSDLNQKSSQEIDHILSVLNENDIPEKDWKDHLPKEKQKSILSKFFDRDKKQTNNK